MNHMKIKSTKETQIIKYDWEKVTEKNQVMMHNVLQPVKKNPVHCEKAIRSLKNPNIMRLQGEEGKCCCVLLGTGSDHDSIAAAKSAYYERLQACFPVKSQVNK